jgi:hypothetical protein
MAHFAKIENNIVANVIVVSNDVVGEYPQSDEIGQTFIASLNLDGNWLQTSYNHNFRKQYATIGGTYDSVKDEFVEPKPFSSWTLDSNNDWQPPVPKPDGMYYWNEESLSWIQVS